MNRTQSFILGIVVTWIAFMFNQEGKDAIFRYVVPALLIGGMLIWQARNWDLIVLETTKWYQTSSKFLLLVLLIGLPLTFVNLLGADKLASIADRTDKETTLQMEMHNDVMLRHWAQKLSERPEDVESNIERAKNGQPMFNYKGLKLEFRPFSGG
ncbi:MAG: hypothetical protein HYU64_03195 [Armatimonadetes bacterium]|nr:hypothetical protein [Armatimonadota bacterium]